MSPPLLVIGYGNTLRNDDGVGPHVADAVAELNLPGVDTIHAPLLTPELADPISRAETVIFVDAVATALPDPKIKLLALEPAGSSQIMAHAADPKTMLAIARDVFGHAPKAFILTIPVQDMAIGDQMSELARKGMDQAVERIKELAGKQ